MSEPTAQAPVPEPEFSKALAKTSPKTHCPVCHQPEVRYAHPHCPTHRKDGKPKCSWLTCKCGIVWDPNTGHYNEPTLGKA